jgi:outer membrane biosynthesis protein TonB
MHTNVCTVRTRDLCVVGEYSHHYAKSAVILTHYYITYSMCANIEALEAKSEELQKTVDDLNAQLEIAKRRAERKPESEKPKEKEAKQEPTTPNSKKPEVSSTPLKTVAPLPELTKEDEDLLRLSDELRESKVAFAQEQRRVTELEEQLASMVQDNNRLHDQLRNWHQRDDEPKSMHEEFSILEEVRCVNFPLFR